MTKATGNRVRAYPRACVACRAKKVGATTIDREMEIKHDGNLHKMMVRALPVEQCEACGEFTIGNEGDVRIDEALREHLGLLMPAQIREKRKVLGLTQEALATAIGCASESISRWESGALVQSNVVDKWLRAYFDVPELRAYFRGEYSEVSHYARVVQRSEPLAQLSERQAPAQSAAWQAVATDASAWLPPASGLQASHMTEKSAYVTAIPTSPYPRLAEQSDVAA